MVSDADEEAKKKKLVVAVYKFEKNAPDELSFEVFSKGEKKKKKSF